MEQFLSPVALAVFLVVVALMAAVGLIVRRYQKVPPNEVLIVVGRKRKIKKEDGGVEEVGFRIVKSGATFILPAIERVFALPLNAMTLEVATEDAYTIDGVPVNVESVVVMKIGGSDAAIASAAERFLGFGADKIQRTAQEVLSGHLRAICSTLKPEDINKDRATFQQKVLEGTQSDFTNMGLQIDSFTVRKIQDKHGYFDALGKKSTANVLRDARVGEAEALERDAVQQESLARQLGQVKKAETEAIIAEAEKERNVKMAQYSGEVAKEKATAEQAGPQADAEAKKKVVEARTELALKEAELAGNSLLATVIKPAEAAKAAAIAKAEGEKAAKVLAAEATQAELSNEGAGESEKKRKIGTAEADVIALKGEADGKAKKAVLVAEAEGLERKAKAMKEFTGATMHLEVVKELIRTLPDIFRAVASPIAAIDSVKVVDLGGGSGDSKDGGPISRLLNVSPRSITQTDEILRTTLGFGMSDIMARFGKTAEIPENPEPIAEAAAISPSKLTEKDKDDASNS